MLSQKVLVLLMFLASLGVVSFLWVLFLQYKGIVWPQRWAKGRAGIMLAEGIPESEVQKVLRILTEIEFDPEARVLRHKLQALSIAASPDSPQSNICTKCGKSNSSLASLPVLGGSHI